MIDKLKWAKEQTDNPKILRLIADMAELSEEAQEALVECIEKGVFG